jgi:hypothetical protein
MYVNYQDNFLTFLNNILQFNIDIFTNNSEKFLSYLLIFKGNDVWFNEISDGIK